MKLRPYIVNFLFSRALVRGRRILFRWHQIRTRQPHCVTFFYQIDDPYSHLVAQILPRLRDYYKIELEIVPVYAPADDAAPERQALEDYARRDAAKIAPYYGLVFADKGQQPDVECLRLAQMALAAADDKCTAAEAIGTLYWAGDKAALEAELAVLEKLPSATEVAAHFTAGTTRRDKMGHYLGAMFHYGGEWYWGIDRLPYLEERFVQLGLRVSDKPQITQFQKRPPFMLQPAKRRLVVEFYPSARSPYSYIAMAEMLDLPNHYPIDLIVRPVLPMVMRGLPVPPRKGFYIMGDTAREAARIGIKYGRLADPVGRPVRRCYSLFPMANKAGVGGAFLHAFCEMAWSRGIDMGSDKGLRRAIESVGLDWQEAQAHLDSNDWEEEVEANRLQMMAAGLWGVPSFRLLDDKGEEIFSAWGRDRIWLLACEIQAALK